MQVVILAGGLGKRMGQLTATLPKPMVRVGGRPMLDYQIDLAARYGFQDVLILTAHRAELIEQHYRDGRSRGVDIRYSRESEPLGTAGAVRLASERGFLAKEFLLFYGDIVMDIDLQAVIAFHRKRGGVATLVVQPTDHPKDSDLVDAEQDGRVRRIFSKPHPDGVELRNLANAALFVVSCDLIPQIPARVPSDFGREVFPAAVCSGLPIYAYRTSEYVKDVGTTERFERAEKDILDGSVTRRCKRFPRPALLLDRDGVINADIGYIGHPDQLKVLPGVPASLRRLNLSDYLSLVVTNQGAIARGHFDEAALERVHARLDRILTEESDAFVDDIFYCPHHPDVSGPCPCRKPAPGLLEMAIAKHNVDRSSSFMIGDRSIDVEAGRAAQLGTIAIAPAHNPYLGEDYRFADLPAAVDFLLGTYGDLAREAERLVLSLMPIVARASNRLRLSVADTASIPPARVFAERLRRRNIVCELAANRQDADPTLPGLTVMVRTEAAVAIFSTSGRQLGQIAIDRNGRTESYPNLIEIQGFPL